MKIAVCGGLIAAAVLSASAANVSLFDDPAHSDTAGPTSSAEALHALLTSQGHQVTTFSGITANDFSQAGAAGILVIPEFSEVSNFYADLTQPAKAAVASHVANGGGLIVVGAGGYNFLNLTLYENQFASTGTTGPSTLSNEQASDTPFLGGPASITQANTGINPFAFTPAGARLLYADNDGGITVLTAPYGNGNYTFLGWDFKNAAPNGALDGGWADVLNRSVAAVPEPGVSTLLLLGFGAMALRRRSAA